MNVWIIALCFSLCPLAIGWADVPAKIVFDTDIAGDVDDALALAMLHALADRDECSIEAVTVSKTHPQNGPMVDAINTFYLKMNDIQAARVVEVQRTLVSQPPSVVPCSN